MVRRGTGVRVDTSSDELASGTMRVAERRSAKDELDAAIRALEIVLQPVVDLRTGSVAGAEALARFRLEPVRSPDVWFAEAWDAGLGLELECAAIALALRELEAMPAPTYLAVNVSPRTLIDPQLWELLRDAPGERVVLELTEHERVDDYAAIHLALMAARERGFRLSVDDAGAGFASFQHILELKPSFIKLDRSLTRSVDADPGRFALAAAFVSFAANLGARICAEGIETRDELAALQRLGVAYGQGYFLGRPLPPPLARRASSWPALPPDAAPDERRADEVREAVRDPGRLSALRETGLLDSTAEEVFDRFAQVAARLLKTPVALVTLVEEERQFFKSAVGLSEPVASRRETPLSHSFCKHVVTQRSPVVIDDSRLSPLVREEHAAWNGSIHAYLGAPIITRDDHALGALCAIDPNPRVWTADDRETLRHLADAVAAEIDQRRALRANHRSDLSLSTAPGARGAGVAVCDDTGVIVRVNAQLSASLGYAEGELHGRPLSTLEHPEDGARLAAVRADVLSGARPDVSAETRYRTRGGEWSAVRLTISKAPGGATGGRLLLVIVEDTEHERRVREAVGVTGGHYRALIRQLPNTSVGLFDRDSRFLVADGDLLLEALGKTRSAIVGRTLQEVASAESLPIVARAFEATLVGEESHFEIRKEGRTLAFHTAPTRDEAARVTGGILVMTDVTARETAARELARYRDSSALLGDISTASNHASNSTIAFQYALERVSAHLGSEVAHFYVREDDELVPSNVWHVADEARSAPFQRVTRTTRFARGVGLMGQVLATGNAEWMHDVAHAPAYVRADAARATGLATGIAFPVLVRDEVVAVIELYTDKAVTPDAEALGLLRHVGEQLGRVVERERHAAASEKPSVRDELTGLLNRRGFFQLGRRALGAARTAQIVSVEVRGISDLLEGEERRDRVLADAAELLRTTFPLPALVGRLGRTQLAVLVVNDEGNGADVLTARAERAVRLFNAGATRPYALDLRFGVATLDAGSPPSLDALVANARRACVG